MAFAENLRSLRLGQFLSQAELARRAGLHALTITRLEAGAAAPSTRSVRALAEALGVEPGELATPHEVAELRRVLARAAQLDGKAGDRLDSWEDDGGAAQLGTRGQVAE
jgi:transcriptional regulator with XRE-family HTH domain